MVREIKYQGNIEQRVLRFIRNNQLLLIQEYLLVAVSGGPDSVCLLHILFKLQKELRLKLYVAHLDHQLRDADSKADAQYVADLAHQLGIPCKLEQRDVKAYQAQHHLSLEEAAREVRYTFLEQTAKSIGANQVAVGHTTNDHTETILLHLIRGTGTRGLQGLKPSGQWPYGKSKLTIIRPLLSVSRQETADYCNNNQLIPRIDISNLSLSPLRNKIRHQLLPLLGSYNPKITEALQRTARITSNDLAFITKETERVENKISYKTGNTITLDKEKFLKLPYVIKGYLLRKIIENSLGTLKDIESRHIEEIINALTKPAGKRISLPSGLVFSIEYDRYLLGPDPAALSPFPIIDNEYLLKIPGDTLIPGWCITASIINHQRIQEKNENFTAYLDSNITGEKLLIRPRQSGDRFQPLGMSRTKKLGEFMIDAKIPSAWRQRIPIVCSSEQIIWVVGWRIDERAKVTDTTERIIQLEFKPS
ncbi:MAG: tRNA lysidine(34) synthetase TilS [Dehalococcoidales bacterium]|nr:tRNA lysidine(34) synthetase TilS [Dehalococcoidales bacterium]